MARRTENLKADEILREAARLFTARGYANTRMQDIAESFSVTHAALYYHFKNKEEVLQRIHEIAIQGLLAGARRVAEADIDAAERFESALCAHIKFVANNTIIVSALFDEERELSDDFFQWIRERRREYNSLMEKMFRQGQEAGRYVGDVDPRYATNLLLGAASWTYRWYRPSRYGNADDFAEKTVQLLARGFLRSCN